MIIDGANALIMAGPAELLDTSREYAWADRALRVNPAFRYLLGRYVEADHANSNGQMWTLPDLQETYKTVEGSPLNMIHKARYIVGHYTDVELLYPTDEKAGAEPTNPYVEALAVLYKYYFPDELAAVEAAHREGALFFSMECVGESLTCAGEGGCGKEFAYAGRNDASYCDHINDGGVRQINRPHFLGGALIIPPVQPGWSNAEIHSLVAKYAAEAEAAYKQVADAAPHLDPAQWEVLMLQVMAIAHRDNAA